MKWTLGITHFSIHTLVRMSADGGGGWGLSSMSAALGGWGLSATEEPAPAAAEPSSEAAADSTAASAEQQSTDHGAGDKPPPPPTRKEQDDEWKETVREVEDAAASVVPAIQSSVKELEGGLGAVEETAARLATDAASSFWSGASSYFSAATGEGGGDAGATSPAAGANAEGGGGTATDAAANVLTSVLQYNPLNNLASKWINELEKADDEHRPLRTHLVAHLKDWERSTYEEWVEECLVAIDGWDRSSAVVDGTFYEEDSLHRRLWNQRMEAIGDEGRMVEARDITSKTSAAGGEPTASVDDETRTKATPVKAAVAKESTAPSNEKSNSAEKEVKGGTVTSTSAVTAAMDLLGNDDDLDGLLGDEEICFVSKPSD